MIELMYPPEPGTDKAHTAFGVMGDGIAVWRESKERIRTTTSLKQVALETIERMIQRSKTGGN